MGNKDSSLTRVKPVFDQLFKADQTGNSWLVRLLSLPVGGNTPFLPPGCRFTIKDCGWGSNEKRLSAPVSLLSWLIRHPRKPTSGGLSSDPTKAGKRRQWLEGSDARRAEALRLLRHNPKNENWHIFEGQTQPDVFIETDDLLVVIEGKRTEREPTTRTKWMAGRHQMLRHLDCAHEIRGRKCLLGFFIVEGEDTYTAVPSKWLEFAEHTVKHEAVFSSLPHRGPDEQREIAAAFIGVTTWQRVCEEFRDLGIDWKLLPDKIGK